MTEDGDISWQHAYRSKTVFTTYVVTEEDGPNGFISKYYNSMQLAGIYPCKDGGYVGTGLTEFYGSEDKNAIVFVTDEEGNIGNTSFDVSELDVTVTDIECPVSVIPETATEDTEMTSEAFTARIEPVAFFDVSDI